MPTAIRPASPADVDGLEAIENAADERFLQRFHPETWYPADNGRARVATPGFVLVAAAAPGEEAIGFVHVVEIDGGAHLEQLSVPAEHGGRGHGRALVEAALAKAAARGCRRMTLRTYADVPWNAPFYARCGFVESDPDTPFLRGLPAIEARLGLPEHGLRIQMTAALDPTEA